MTRFLINTARFVHRYHKCILFTAASAAILFILFIGKIEIKSDMMDVMPADNPSMKIFTDILNDFQRINSLTVVVDSGPEEIEQHIEFVEGLAQQISKSDLIKDVDYSFINLPWGFLFKHFPLFLDEKGLILLKQKLTEDGINRQIRKNYRLISSFLSSPADAAMITEDPLDIRSLFKTSALKSQQSGMDVSSGYYLSSDHTKAYIFVTPGRSGRDFSYLNQLKSAMEGIADRTLAGYEKDNNLKVEFTGGYAVSWEAQEDIRKDMLFSVLMTAMLVLLIFLFVYRGRMNGLFIISATIFMALIVTLTSAVMLFNGLNLVTALVSAMLIGLGFDYALHIFDRYQMEFSIHGNSLYALETTFAHTGKSIITSAITTSFAFFSIVITSFKGLHELGMIAGIGIIASMLSSLIVLGSLLAWSSRRGNSRMHYYADNRILEDVVPDFVYKYAKPLLAAVCIGVIILSSGIWRLEFVSDISRIGLKHSRALELQESLFEQSGSRGLPVILTYKGEESFDRIFDDMEQTMTAWSEKGYAGDYRSLGSVLPPPHKQRSAILHMKEIYGSQNNIEQVFLSSLEKNNFIAEDRNVAYIRNIMNALQIESPISVEDLPEVVRSKVNMFYNSEKGRAAAYIYPPDGQWDPSHLTALEEDLKRMGKGWQLTGWQLLQGDLEKSIIKDSLIAACLSFAFILFMLYLHFRKVTVIFLVQLPLLFGILFTVGIMGHSGIGFNYINISAVAIIFGISVDYGVYFMQSFLEMKDQEDKGLVRHAFKNIAICSLTTMAGFGSLIFTSFRGISSLGQVIIIGILSCLMMSALLLPVSDRLLKK